MSIKCLVAELLSLIRKWTKYVLDIERVEAKRNYELQNYRFFEYFDKLYAFELPFDAWTVSLTL